VRHATIKLACQEEQHDVKNLHHAALRGEQRAPVSDSSQELLQYPKRQLRAPLKGRRKEEESITC